MGTGLAMIDRHYGLLARDGRVHALLDTYRAANPSTSTRWTPGGLNRHLMPTLTTEDQ